MRALVTYGTKRQGTAGIAEIVAATLRENHVDVDVSPAQRGIRADGYDAVIVGGAIYMGRWHRDAIRFVKRNAAVLERLPVWFFSSGPLDDSATTTTIAPVPGVEALMSRIGARGHITFGGRLEPDAKGFPASAMAKTRSGDWRDPGQIVSWAREVADELSQVPS